MRDAVQEVSTICMNATKHEVDPNTRFDIKPHLLRREEGNEELDSALYVSAPQLSWDAMLKDTRLKFQLIKDA